jgi:dihydroorotase
VQQCLEYRDRLRAIEPNVDYLMSLYLHEHITPEVIREAKKAGITGVKSYPAGVTTVCTLPSHPLDPKNNIKKTNKQKIHNRV